MREKVLSDRQQAKPTIRDIVKFTKPVKEEEKNSDKEKVMNSIEKVLMNPEKDSIFLVATHKGLVPIEIVMKQYGPSVTMPEIIELQLEMPLSIRDASCHAIIETSPGIFLVNRHSEDHLLLINLLGNRIETNILTPGARSGNSLWPLRKQN